LFLSYKDTDDGHVVVPVEVVWHRTRSRASRSGMGLRFLNLEAGERFFENFLSQRSERKSIPPALLAWAADTVVGKIR
jgi:hypothetical protein